MKIGMKLLFTLKNKCKFFLIWVLKTTSIYFDPQKRLFLVFEVKPHKQFVSSCFGFDSALNLNNGRTNVLLISIFENAPKKTNEPSKMPFWLFLAVINLFQRIFKNIDQNNICASIVFKAKTKDKYEETFFKGFLFHSKMHFLGGQPILFWIFFLSAFASKTIDSQLLFWLICFKMHFKKLITAKNCQNGVFDS